MSSGPLTVFSTGSLVLKDLDKEFTPATTEAGATISAKQKINGITYTLLANDTTVRQGARSLQGLWGQASMPLGEGITGSVAYDFGGRHSAAAVTASRTLLDSGRPLDLGFRWAEKGNAFTLDASTKPHPNHKVFASVNPRTGAAIGSWLADVAVPLPEKLGGKKPVSLGIARNFAKNTTSLSAARSVAGAKVGASYALEEGVANLTVFKAPLRAMVKAKRQQPAAAGGLGGLSSSSWGRPSVSLSIDRELQLDTPWGARAKAAPKQLPKTKGGNPLTDSALFKRLGEIDSLLWKKEEKKVEAAPVKSWSFLKKA